MFSNSTFGLLLLVRKLNLSKVGHIHNSCSGNKEKSLLVTGKKGTFYVYIHLTKIDKKTRYSDNYKKFSWFDLSLIKYPSIWMNTSCISLWRQRRLKGADGLIRTKFISLNQVQLHLKRKVICDLCWKYEVILTESVPKRLVLVLEKVFGGIKAKHSTDCTVKLGHD